MTGEASLAGGPPMRIAIEAKDRTAAAGRKPLTDQLETIMNTREATHGIWVSRNISGFSKEIGEWGEGAGTRGPWIACTMELLPVALRFHIVQDRLRKLRENQQAVDSTSIMEQVLRIQTALKKIGNISRKVGDIRASAQEIQNESESLREEIKTGLGQIEDAVRRQAGDRQTAA